MDEISVLWQWTNLSYAGALVEAHCELSMQVNEADGQSRGQIAHHGPERDAIVEGQRMEMNNGEATGPLGVRRAAALTLLHTYCRAAL